MMRRVVGCVGLLVFGSSCGGKSVEPAPPTVVESERPASTPEPPVASDHATDCEAVVGDDAPGHHDRYSFTDNNELVGFKNKAGDIVIEPRFLMAYEFNKTGVAGAVEQKPVRAVFIDVTGTVRAQAHMFDNGPDYFVNGLARIVDGGKLGFIDAHGNIVVKPQFAFAGSFCGGRARVCLDCTGRFPKGTFGYIDRTGKLVIPYQFERADMFTVNGTAVVTKGGERYTIDRDGKRIPTTP